MLSAFYRGPRRSEKRARLVGLGSAAIGYWSVLANPFCRKELVTPMRDIAKARPTATLPAVIAAAALAAVGSACVAAPQTSQSTMAAKSLTSTSVKLSAGDRRFATQAAQG